MDILERIETLEKKFEELKLRTTGPRGPAGNIDAALRSVRNELPELLHELFNATNFRGPKGEPGAPPQKEVLESILVLMMEEYGLLRSDGEAIGPQLQFAIKKAVAKEVHSALNLPQ